MGETVRFSEVVKAAGGPEVYLPLSEPKQDRTFMRAVREKRVLSLKQEPTGTKRDFGTVGYLPERFVTYLIFPRSLQSFAGRRVIGIKYEALSSPALLTVKAGAKAALRPHKAKSASKPKPHARRYTATVRLSAMKEVQVTVHSSSEKEARSKAMETALRRNDLAAIEVEAEVLRLDAVPR